MSVVPLPEQNENNATVPLTYSVFDRDMALATYRGVKRVLRAQQNMEKRLAILEKDREREIGSHSTLKFIWASLIALLGALGWHISTSGHKP